MDPDRTDATTGKDGRFEIKSVDASKRWLLVVWDPFRPKQRGAERGVDLEHDNVIQLSKQLDILEPPEGAVVAGPEVAVRWTPLPGAARYTLEASEIDWSASSKSVRRTTTAAETTVPVLPARYYFLTLKALDRDGIVIGEDCIPSCTVFEFGVSDPKAERALEPMDGTCVMAGKEPELRVAPSPAPRTRAPFLVSTGDQIRLLGKLGTWRKVRTLTGHYPGREGWLRAEQVDCAKAGP